MNRLPSYRGPQIGRAAVCGGRRSQLAETTVFFANAE
jgi:hypothetical protein